jgi:hypothetical protein
MIAAWERELANETSQIAAAAAAAAA